MLPQKIDKIEIINEEIHQKFIKNNNKNPIVSKPFEFWWKIWFLSNSISKIRPLFLDKASINTRLQNQTIKKPSEIWAKRILLYTKKEPVGSIYIELLYNEMFWNLFHKIQELEKITFEIKNTIIWLKWNREKNEELSFLKETLLNSYFSYFFVLSNSLFEILNIFLQIPKLIPLKVGENVGLDNGIETLKRYCNINHTSFLNSDIIQNITTYRNKFGHKGIPMIDCGFNKKNNKYEAYFQYMDSEYLLIDDFVMDTYIKTISFIEDFWKNYNNI